MAPNLDLWRKQMAHRKAVYVCGLVVGLCLLVSTVRWMRSAALLGSAFPSSSRVASRELSESVLDSQVRQLVRLQFQSPRSCGRVAPDLRVYRQFAVLRMGDKQQLVFNPSFTRVADTDALRLFQETNEFCNDTIRRPEKRLWRVVARYDDLVRHQFGITRTLEGPEALCWQQTVDLLNGVWPCDYSTTSAGEGPSDEL